VHREAGRIRRWGSDEVDDGLAGGAGIRAGEVPVSVRFLSAEWAQELEDRLNANPPFTQAIGSQSVKIQQVITGSADGPMQYWLRLENGRVELGVGELEGPDAIITQDYDSAVALARSELNPVTAFMTGRIKIAGNMMILMGLQNALALLPGVMGEMDIEY
jgi:putative sterol carrier protein